MRISKTLFNYLDGFYFVDDTEKNGAICDFFGLDCPSYWEVARAGDIVEFYNEYLRLKKEWKKADWDVLRRL